MVSKPFLLMTLLVRDEIDIIRHSPSGLPLDFKIA